MPRRPRVDGPGLLHHVMLRGIERRRIFRDDCDRRDLLNRLSRILPEAGMSCYAWALMPNHVHLVLRTGPIAVATVMARVNTGYALGFNRRHARVGYLFQNRYKSLLVEKEAYLLALVRYVHRNPLRSGIVSSLEALGTYRWTGHATLMGQGAVGFQDAQGILAQFGETTNQARRRLIEWMRGDSDSSVGIPERILAPETGWLGASDTRREGRASGAMAPHAGGVRRKRGHRASVGSSLPELMARVCMRRDVPVSEILARARSRPIANARAEIVYRACTELGLAGDAVARALGLSKGGVSRARVRGRSLLSSDPDEK